MADLGSRTTSGELAWDKYVYRNKNWKELTLSIEKSTELVERDGAKVKKILDLKVGDTIKLESNITSTIGSKKYASVKVSRTEGYVIINAIRKPTNFKPTGYEAEVVSLINQHIARNSNIPIDIVIKGDNKVYKGIAGAIQVDTSIKRLAGVTADPKADIILYVDKNNLQSNKNIYISHKKEGGPEAFQQYGGLTEKAGEAIYNHPETKKFLKAVAGNIDPAQGLKNPMMMKVDSDRLKNLSIYGPDYGKPFGLQHVQLIGQGLPKLTPTNKENVYTLEFSSHTSISGDLSHFGGGYTPVFGATYRAGRGFELDGVRYNGARVGIYPSKLIETRGGVVEVK